MKIGEYSAEGFWFAALSIVRRYCNRYMRRKRDER